MARVKLHLTQWNNAAIVVDLNDVAAIEQDARFTLLKLRDGKIVAVRESERQIAALKGLKTKC